MSRSWSRLTSGRSSTPRTTLKMAALAPMPRARVKTTVKVRPLARIRERSANLRSVIRLIVVQRRRRNSRLSFHYYIEPAGPLSTVAREKSEAGRHYHVRIRPTRSITSGARAFHATGLGGRVPVMMSRFAKEFGEAVLKIGQRQACRGAQAGHN